MRPGISRKPLARRDLIEIWSHIAEDNESAADQLLDRIDELLRMLRDNPKAGRMREELAHDLRSFPVGNYMMFYRPTDAGIMLVRVLSARLDIAPDDFS